MRREDEIFEQEDPDIELLNAAGDIENGLPQNQERKKKWKMLMLNIFVDPSLPNAEALFVVNMLSFMLDLYAVYSMFAAFFHPVILLPAVGFLAFAFPRFGTDAESRWRQCSFRLSTWLMFDRLRIVSAYDMWPRYYCVCVLIYLFPYFFFRTMYSERVKKFLGHEDEPVPEPPNDRILGTFYAQYLESRYFERTKKKETEAVQQGYCVSAIPMFLLFYLSCEGRVLGHELTTRFTIPETYLPNSRFIDRPLLHKEFIHSVLNYYEPTIVYGHDGTGRRTFVVNKMLSMGYEVVWFPITEENMMGNDAITDNCFWRSFYWFEKPQFIINVLESSLVTAMMNWKFDCETFKNTRRLAVVIDYSLIDLTEYNPDSSLMRKEMELLKRIASMGIKVIVIANEMVSIFDAAHRAEVVSFFVKVDDFTHDEAVQFFNQTASRSALSISNDEMESLFARVGTRPIDIRNYIETFKTYSESPSQFALRMEEYEIKAMTGWINNHPNLKKRFIQAQSCKDVVTGNNNNNNNNVAPSDECGVDMSESTMTPSDYAVKCAPFDHRADIVSQLIMHPNTSYHEAANYPPNEMDIVKRLAVVFDFDIAGGSATFGPRSTVQKRMLEAKKFVEIKDCPTAYSTKQNGENGVDEGKKKL